MRDCVIVCVVGDCVNDSWFCDTWYVIVRFVLVYKFISCRVCVWVKCVAEDFGMV